MLEQFRLMISGRIQIGDSYCINRIQLDLSISNIQLPQMRSAQKEYKPNQISELSYQCSTKSLFTIRDYTLMGINYKELQFQLIDDLDEEHQGTMFLAVISKAQESGKRSQKKQQRQQLKQNQTYLLIKLLPELQLREKFESGRRREPASEKNINRFVIKDNHGTEEKQFLYSLECIKINKLSNEVSLSDEETYENIYQLIKNMEYGQPNSKSQRRNTLVWVKNEYYYINNSQIKLVGKKKNYPALNNILGIMKLLLKNNRSHSDSQQLPPIALLKISSYKGKIEKYNFSQKYKQIFSAIWQNCIQFIQQLQSPNSEEEQSSPAQSSSSKEEYFSSASKFSLGQMPEHIFSLAEIEKTLIFTQFKPNRIKYLGRDPLEPWVESQILKQYSDLQKDQNYSRLLRPAQKQTQQQLDRPIDYFLINQLMKIQGYFFKKEKGSDLKQRKDYGKDVERIVWIKALQQKGRDSVQRIRDIIPNYGLFSCLSQLALIECNLVELPKLYRISSPNKNALVGFESLRGLFLDRNHIRTINAAGKGDAYSQLQLLSVNRNPIQSWQLSNLPKLRLLRVNLTSEMKRNLNKTVVTKPIIECVLPLPENNAQFIGYQFYLPRLLPQVYKELDQKTNKIYQYALYLIDSGYDLYYRVEAFPGAKQQSQSGFYHFLKLDNWKFHQQYLKKILEEENEKEKHRLRQKEKEANREQELIEVQIKIATQKESRYKMKKIEIKQKKQSQLSYSEDWSERQKYFEQPPKEREKIVFPTKKYSYISWRSQKHFRKTKYDIYFPHQNPYPVQLSIMEYIYKNLENNNDFMIQSQTGSGKTLSILAAVLAWVENDNVRKAQILKKREQDVQKGIYIKWGQVDRSQNQPINKIIYMSRSHTQIEQVSEQLKQTCYRPDVVVLGSRLKLCAHQTVSQAQQVNQINKKCQHAIEATRQLAKLNNMSMEEKLKSQLFNNPIELKKRVQYLEKEKCIYYKQFEERVKINNEVFMELSGVPVTIEIEKEKAKMHQTCPYYYPSSGKFYANLILMPYIYILNNNLLSANLKYIPNSILIFDEGHNILAEAEEGASFTIRESFFTHALKDLQKLLKDKPEKQLKLDSGQGPNKKIQELTFDPQQYEKIRLQQLHYQPKYQPKQKAKTGRQQKRKENRSQGLALLKQFDQNFQKYREKKIEQLQKKRLEQIRKQKVAKKKRESRQNQEQQDAVEYENEVPDEQQQGESREAKKERIDFIRSDRIKSEIILAFEGNRPLQANIQIDFQEFLQKIARLCKYLAVVNLQMNRNNQENGKTKIYVTSLTKLQNKLQQIVQISERTQDYGLYLHSVWREKYEQQEVIKFKEQKGQKKQLNKKRSLFLKLRCFDSSLMFNKIKQLKPKSIMIASGTLFPPDNWDPYTSLRLESSESPKFKLDFNKQQIMTINVSKFEGQPLKLTSKNLEKNLDLVFKTIQIICKATPQGVLVIFPSKDWIIKIKKIVGKKKVGNKIARFENKKQTKNLDAFIESYKQQCLQGWGAVLFVVCRGSLSEGINFKDQLCRAVVMVGVPLLPYKDPYVVGKQQYCDKKNEQDTKQKNIKKEDRHQTGAEWAKAEAARTVNQGIGRVIRTIQDYGVIYLLDERYSKNYNYRFFRFGDISEWATQEGVFKDKVDASQIEGLSKQFFNRQEKRKAAQKLKKEKTAKMQQH